MLFVKGQRNPQLGKLQGVIISLCMTLQDMDKHPGLINDPGKVAGAPLIPEASVFHLSALSSKFMQQKAKPGGATGPRRPSDGLPRGGKVADWPHCILKGLFV